jgi:hypothetical protein
MMDSFALNLALRVAQDWATNNDPAYGRYFDLAPVDRQWLVQATESDLAELASLPSSILLVNIGTLSEVRISEHRDRPFRLIVTAHFANA